MSFFKWILCGGFLLQIATATASTDTPDKVLRIYGPGGPHHVLQECADLYLKKTGVDVAVDEQQFADDQLRLRLATFTGR